MEFNRSIIGPIVDPQIAILKNHPVTNSEVGLNDRSFERLCIDMGVSQHDLNADRSMRTGQSIEQAVEPEVNASDFNFENMNKENSFDSGLDFDLDLSGLDR